MKKIRFLLLFLLLFLVSTLTSCAADFEDIVLNGDIAGKDDILYEPSSPDSEKGDYVEGGYDVAVPSEPSGGDTGEGSESNHQGPAPGQITASAWNDMRNYDFWLSLFDQDSDNQENSLNEYFIKLNEYTSSINTQKMITVSIKNNDQPISNYHVSISNYNYSFTAKTDVFGNAYLFIPTDSEFPYTIKYGNEVYELTSYQKEPIQLSVNESNKPSELLDLMFVIDTTGSMGDEIRYLKAEIKNVIENINIEQKNVRLGLLFYRDEGDVYVTKLSDFTTDIAYQVDFISNQSANGGGDYPEAVDQALDEAINKASWSNENTESTKILIHVLDAPPHYTKTNLQLFSKSIITAAEKGIRIIPVASSGIDKWTEFLLRTEALMTGGTYTYITNDSGIGGGHIDATVPEKVVEYLNAMLIRLINEYHTGIIKEPVPYNQKQDK